jgi:hypothetical protein
MGKARLKISQMAQWSFRSPAKAPKATATPQPTVCMAIMPSKKQGSSFQCFNLIRKLLSNTLVFYHYITPPHNCKVIIVFLIS